MRHLTKKTIGVLIGIFAFIAIQAQPNTSEIAGNKGIHKEVRIQEMKKPSNHRKHEGVESRLKLTDDQKKAMKTMRMEQFKEMQPLENELKELKVHQHSLMSAFVPDLIAINKNIDQITAAQNKIEKARAKHVINFKSNLTEEQKIMMAQAFKMKRGEMGKPNKPEGKNRRSPMHK